MAEQIYGIIASRKICQNRLAPRKNHFMLQSM